MLENETITLRATKIGGQTYPDDYAVTWRGLRIGRIRKNPGLPAHLDQWSWGCNVYGQPPRRDDSGQPIRACPFDLTHDHTTRCSAYGARWGGCLAGG